MWPKKETFQEILVVHNQMQAPVTGSVVTLVGQWALLVSKRYYILWKEHNIIMDTHTRKNNRYNPYVGIHVCLRVMRIHKVYVNVDLYLIIQDTRRIWLWFTSTRLECFYIIFNIHKIGTFSCFSNTFSMVLLSSMVRSSPCPVTQGGIAGQLSDDGVRLLARRGGHKSSSLGVRQTQDFPLSLWYIYKIYI